MFVIKCSFVYLSPDCACYSHLSLLLKALEYDLGSDDTLDRVVKSIGASFDALFQETGPL
jgi:hypothetical protein